MYSVQLMSSRHIIEDLTPPILDFPKHFPQTKKIFGKRGGACNNSFEGESGAKSGWGR